jgi:NAD(P)-dependent dehydrogenase (short-subunit alcohol dehydrogenase family)
MTEPGQVEGVVLVTGGTGGLGSAVIADLLDAGAEVVTTWLVDHERERFESSELGGRDRLTLVEANLLEDGANAAVAACRELGSLRGVVNVAGGFASGPRFHETDSGELDKMIALNLKTAANTSRAGIPAMLDAGGGSIVCVGARAALEPFGGGSSYAISKASVLALVRALDADYRQDGIRANAILPSVIDTPANRDEMPDADHSKWVTPAQIARVIRFLCSADSAPVSGAAIPVYGRA